MTDFKFFAKTFMLTIAVVILMQIEIGQRTIEKHAHSWVQTSAIVAPLHEVAHGAGQLIRDVAKQMSKSIRQNVFKSKKEKPPAPPPKPDNTEEDVD